MNEGKVVLVSGATGAQGGAVVNSLLKRKFAVRALVRDVNKPSAQRLQSAGASLVQGNFDDAESLRRALDKVYGVFSVQNFFEAGFDKEVEQGCRFADEAYRAGVQHFVFSSVIGADRKSNIPHFESKWQIENHIRSLAMSYTILRAVAYMDNWFTYKWLEGERLYVPIKEDTVWQMIAVRDIGEFVHLALSQPEQFVGKELEIAGDQFTVPQAAKIFSENLGRRITYAQQPLDDVKKYSEEIALMFEWFNERANFADLEQLRKIHPDLWTLSQWLRQTDAVKQSEPV